jgi:hypothetical protein
MGGNVFTLAGPIKKEHIPPTMKEFYRELGKVFPQAKKHFSGMKPLGSTGKKAVSGDIDLALDAKSVMKIEDWGLDREQVLADFRIFKKRARSATNKLLIKRAIIVNIARKIDAKSKKISTDVKGSASGTLFLAHEQIDETGKGLGKHVQIDVNVGDLDWLTFSYFSKSYEGNVKGLHRTQLLVSLFTGKGYTFSHNYGVKNKKTQEVEASNPEEAVALLNKLYGTKLTKSTIADYFKVMKSVLKDLSSSERMDVLDRYLRILDSTRADIPQDLQPYWIKHKKRIGLTGKFLPDTSALQNYV